MARTQRSDLPTLREYMAQGLARAAAGVLVGVMDQEDGQVELALELAQIGEEGGHLGGVVFLKAMEPDERIHDQQDRAVLFDGQGKASRTALVGHSWKATVQGWELGQ